MVHANYPYFFKFLKPAFLPSFPPSLPLIHTTLNFIRRSVTRGRESTMIHIKRKSPRVLSVSQALGKREFHGSFNKPK